MSYFWNGYILRDFIFHNFNTNTVPGFIGVFVALFSVGILYEGLFFLKKGLLQKFFRLARSNRPQTGRRGFPVFHSFQPSESDDTSPTGGGDSLENGVASGDTNNPRNSLLAGEEVPGLGDEPVSSPSSQEVGGGSGSGNSRSRSARRISFQFPLELGLPTPESSYLLMSSILHGCYAFIGYTLMNAVMTFNLWVLVAICTGIGMGYFVFRSESSVQLPRKSSTQPFRNAIETDDDDDPAEYHQRSPRSHSSASSSRNKTDNLTPSKSPAGSSSGGVSRGSSGRRNRIPDEESSQKTNDKNTSLPDDGDTSTVVGQVIVVGAQVHNNYQQSV